MFITYPLRAGVSTVSREDGRSVRISAIRYNSAAEEIGMENLRGRTLHNFASFALALGIVLGVPVTPVRQFALADSEEPPIQQSVPFSTPKKAAAPLTGPQVYREVCIACHAPPGVGGAPALGDRDAWAPRIAQGMETLIEHALRGFSSSTGGIMPRKGGRLDLSDEEVIGAVQYMVEQATQ